MTTVTAEDAQTRLPELLDRVAGGDGVVITRGAHPVARLVAEQPPPRKPRAPGSAKGMLTIVSDDDDHLADFAEYME